MRPFFRKWFDDGPDPEWLMLSRCMLFSTSELISSVHIYTFKFIWYKISLPFQHTLHFLFFSPFFCPQRPTVANLLHIFKAINWYLFFHKFEMYSHHSEMYNQFWQENAKCCIMYTASKYFASIYNIHFLMNTGKVN